MESDSYLYYCPGCGRQVSQEDRICLKCGATLKVENTD